MGVSLYYETIDTVSDDIAHKIQAEVEELTPQLNWWSESIHLWLDEGKLTGSTKIFLIGYGSAITYEEVDPEEDSIMAWRDTKQVIGALQNLAKKYNVKWKIGIEEPELGIIDGSDADEAVIEMADQFLMISGIEPDDPTIQSRIDSINAKYSDCWD